MKGRIRLILATAAVGLAGCAAAPSTQRDTDPRPSSIAPLATPANASLGEIEPRVSLAPGKGSSAGQAPLQAVHLYAEARAAMLDHQQAEAIALMEQAVAADPLSYELHRTLGRMYLTPTTDFSARSITMLEKAAELEPDHLDLQTDLGRQYVAAGDLAKALWHLRQAVLTREYQANPPAAAVTEFFLATLLRGQGYDRAALEVYQRLVGNLERLKGRGRFDPEIAPLLQHLDTIRVEVADLLARRGEFQKAIDAYAAEALRQPGNFELRVHHVRLLLALKRGAEALAAAEDTAIHFRADAASVALLNEASRGAGQDDGAAGALSRLHAKRPADHAVLYALADALQADKRNAEAERILTDAAGRDPADFQIVRRRFAFAEGRHDRLAAARVLIDATAEEPDLEMVVAPLFSQLARPSAFGRLRLKELVALDVSEKLQVSKAYWVSHVAVAAHHRDIARAALQRATSAAGRPFAPAYRRAMLEIWSGGALDTGDAVIESNQLLSQARALSGAALAEELQGLMARNEGDAKAAEDHFSQAVNAGGHSESLLLARADLLRRNGEGQAADSLLWKLISDHPALGDAYLDLYLSSIRRDLENQAERAVTQWLAADPQSVTARRIQAIQYQRAGRREAAERILIALFNQHADDPEAVEAVEGFYVHQHQTDRFVAMLQTRAEKEPWNLAVISSLAVLLADAHRRDEAAHVVDTAKSAAGDDSDLLYTIAGLYSRIGCKPQSEQALGQVLKIDPSHAAAANDLGYAWAESGRNLLQAQALIHAALAAEPANGSFLDSMGWVLYKRGRFAEARGKLDMAVGGTHALHSPDPVSLDHRGDVLYRLSEKDAAAADWSRAADLISEMHEAADDDMKSLHAQLMEKTRRLQEGLPVPVAPLAPEDPPLVK